MHSEDALASTLIAEKEEIVSADWSVDLDDDLSWLLQNTSQTRKSILVKDVLGESFSSVFSSSPNATEESYVSMESSYSGHFSLMAHITDLPQVSSDSTSSDHTCENCVELTAKVDRYREHNEDLIMDLAIAQHSLKSFKENEKVYNDKIKL